MFTTPLPTLPAPEPRALERDVSRRPGWHWPELTDRQRIERIAFEIAHRKGELRGLPTVFGDLT